MCMDDWYLRALPLVLSVQSSNNIFLPDRSSCQADQALLLADIWTFTADLYHYIIHQFLNSG
jgi:hypothetical protein